MQPWMIEAFSYLAGAAGESLDLGILAQYGILGLVAGGLLIFSKGAYNRELERANREMARADRLEAEVTRLNNQMFERVIPLLTSTAGVVEDVTELLRDFQREREYSALRGQAAAARRSRASGEERP